MLKRNETGKELGRPKKTFIHNSMHCRRAESQVLSLTFFLSPLTQICRKKNINHRKASRILVKTKLMLLINNSNRKNCNGTNVIFYPAATGCGRCAAARIFYECNNHPVQNDLATVKYPATSNAKGNTPLFARSIK